VDRGKSTAIQTLKKPAAFFEHRLDDKRASEHEGRRVFVLTSVVDSLERGEMFEVMRGVL